ncbi:MAG: DUF2721 domain-containing protein [Verrucomicrobiales bacterium]|nr:DUF2721 domain-containing protein [Verrucomicrobiales bacterium]
MNLEISTPALLFPAVSLLFLSYTNRFLHLAALVRTLHRDWIELRDEALRAQIDNLRKRLVLIRWMQLMGAASLLLCVVTMVAVAFEFTGIGSILFVIALILMGTSLFCLLFEIWCSGGALQILLKRVEEE